MDDDGQYFNFSDLLNHDDLPSGSVCCGSVSDSFFDGVSWEADTTTTEAAHLRTCTHTHICVPPVEDPSHAHTCVHVHAHATTVATAEAEAPSAGSSRKLPSGSGAGNSNRAAVRKYREKKKAHAASLEQQVRHLTALNQQLTAHVAALQAENMSKEVELTRFRCLFVELKGRIDQGIIIGADALPYQIQIQRPAVIRNMVDGQPPHQEAAFLGISNSVCDFRCNDPRYCANPAGPGIMVQGSSSAHHHQVVPSSLLGQQGAREGGTNIQCIGGSTNDNIPAACGGMDASGSGPAAAGACIPNVEKN